jgi:glycerol kinase
VHATDVSNAARTLMFNVHTSQWDAELLALLDIPRELLQAMTRDAVAAGGAAVTELRVDGGACVNDLLMQFQADLLGIPVVRPRVVETTALGAAYLAGLSSGVWPDTGALATHWHAERRFLPTMPRERADELMSNWARAVRQTTAQ